MSNQIFSATAASITELKRNPMGTLKKGNGSAVAILDFAYYVELAEDAELNRIVEERMASLDRVSVSLDNL